MNLLTHASRLFRMRLILVGVLSIVADAGTVQSYKVSTIDATGQYLASIFQGLPPNRVVRDFLLSRASRSVASAPNVRDSEIGRFLKVATATTLAACPTGGICASPGTTAVAGQFCEDAYGCAVDVHNQANTNDFTQGTNELYDCLQCCVDWSSCPIDTPPPPPGCTTVPLAGGPVGEVSCNGGGPGSPVILDTEGEGFHLTSAATGVKFDISGAGHPVQIAWTDPRFHNAFLALPGPDGLVHNGKELFGNFTPQPLTNDPNGFLALAEFDKPANGGNGDGVIDERDSVYSRLRLWIDENHDGISQPNELHPLAELGVYSLALHYAESRRTDGFGNQFRFRARVDPGGPHDFRDQRQHGEDNEVGRWAYDVFFVTAGK